MRRSTAQWNASEAIGRPIKSSVLVENITLSAFNLCAKPGRQEDIRPLSFPHGLHDVQNL
jgi:hypothetical protein